MSIKIVKQQIQDFLSHDTPEVLAVKGAWGIGKTYSWNKFLLEAKNESRISLDKYSYVSLFGIDSLETFKYSIFEHIINKDIIGEDANIETFKSNTTRVLEKLGRKSLSWFKGTSILKNFTPAIESLSFLSLNKTIICIDDLERKGSNLSIKDVLGLASHLKEQKKCKIVFLLNENEQGLDDYKKYKEKVIDIELKFDPTALESSDIAFDSNNENHKKLSALTQKLDIRNIRVLKKIERLVKIISPLVNDFEPEISSQVNHSIVLFSWCYYCSDDNAPPLEFVTKLGYDTWGLDDGNEEDNEKSGWKNTVNEYGYKHTDELDIVLADAVKTGFINEDEFKTKASKTNIQILAAKSEGSYSETWRLYHDSFDNNQEEVISELYKSFKKNVKNISPTSLNGTVRLFRELNEETKASEIIDYYIKEREQETGLFNMEENNFFGDIQDKEIIDKFNDKYKSSIKVESASEILSRIAGQNGWNQKDEIILSNTTVDEYYELFKRENGPHLSSYIRTCLRFGQLGSANEQQKEIGNRATQALKRIARESEINKLRVRKFGIEVDEQPA